MMDLLPERRWGRGWPNRARCLVVRTQASWATARRQGTLGSASCHASFFSGWLGASFWSWGHRAHV